MNELEVELEKQMDCLVSLKEIQDSLIAWMDGNSPEIDLDQLLLKRADKLKMLENSMVFKDSATASSVLDEKDPLSARMRKIHQLQIAIIPREEKILARLENLKGDRRPAEPYAAPKDKAPGYDFRG